MTHTDGENLEPLIRRMQWAVFAAEVQSTVDRLPETRKPPLPPGEGGRGGVSAEESVKPAEE